MPRLTRVKPPAASSASDAARDRVGVGLGGHLRLGRQPEPVPYAAQHRHEVGRRQQRGSAAPDEHRLDLRRPVAEHAPGQVELAQGGRRIRAEAGAGHGAVAQLRERVGVEVAVPAADRAEGDVHVDPERRAPEPRERRRGQLAGGRGGFAVRKGARHVDQCPSGQPVCVVTP